jgi:RNA polymerase sigma factor (sigma-70 family)
MFERTKNDSELLQASLGSQTQRDAFGVPLQGSPKAFGVLVSRYQALVCAITYSATGSVERSEELAQEVFLRAWRSLSQLQDLSKFRAWLCSIARSTVQNWFRDRRHDVVGRAVPLDAVADKPAEESGPEEAAMIQEQRAVVGQALSEIPESLREPLILFYREQKSVREVAAQFGLTEDTARQRISRGRRLLRKQVAHLVESTVARSRPGKAFTAAVIACIAGTAGKSSAAVAVVGAASAAGQSAGLASLLSGATARIAAAAAVLAVVTAGFLACRQFIQSAEPAGSNFAATTISGESPTEVRAGTHLAAVGTMPEATRWAEPGPGVPAPASPVARTVKGIPRSVGPRAEARGSLEFRQTGRTALPDAAGLPVTALEGGSDTAGHKENRKYRLLMSKWKRGSYVAEHVEDTVGGGAEPGAGDGGMGAGAAQDRSPSGSLGSSSRLLGVGPDL